jgi:DNA-binding HxlR family transcriptional regulator
MTPPESPKNTRGSRTTRPVMTLLDLLGRRWVLRILWELQDESVSFLVLQERCDAMSSSVLSQRLTDLREAGIVQQNRNGTYTLSLDGINLLQALAPLEDWALHWTQSENLSQER